MTNHEPREKVEFVDLFLAFARPKDGEPTRKCIRTIIRDYDLDLAILEAKLRLMGGVWRIHKTVNSRDVEKARKNLLHKLIEEPEFASCVDSVWRTALLQPNCIWGTKKFMLDIDTENQEELNFIDNAILIKSNGVILEKVKTPKGWHYITNAFDTRAVIRYKNVTLLRDGYVFVKKIE